MTEQEIFDTVLTHLRESKGRPLRPTTAAAGTETQTAQPAPWDA